MNRRIEVTEVTPERLRRGMVDAIESEITAMCADAENQLGPVPSHFDFVVAAEGVTGWDAPYDMPDVLGGWIEDAGVTTNLQIAEWLYDSLLDLHSNR